MKKTYHGSCHCGAIRYEADIDLSQGTSKCNCSICTKTRNWNAIIKPEDFRLLSGQDSLGDYQFNTQSNHHFFCKHCGVRPFGQGYVKEIGGAYISVMLSALDDASPDELMEARLQYANGRDNSWWTEPEETRHL